MILSVPYLFARPLLLALLGSTLWHLRDMPRDSKKYPKAAELYRNALAYSAPDTREFFDLDFSPSQRNGVD